MGLGRLDPKLGKAIVAAAQEVIDGKLDDAFPAGRVADRLRHAVEHERQRGDLEPRDRDAGRRDGLQEARAPQRPRQHEPVVERHLSDGHAHRLRGGDPASSAARAAASAQGARRQGEGVGAHHQDRAHAYAGRHADHAGPGVLRLRHAGGERHPAHRIDAAGPDAAGPGRHRRRHRPQRAHRLRREGGGAHRRDHGPAVHQRAQQVRGARRARRDGDEPRRHQHGGGLAVQDRQRHPLSRQRSALGARRAVAARERAGLLDHAGQGEPDAVARR